MKTENLLSCSEELVHHHFALVETWREVSKVLPANSLILKIWMAWAEEAQNVSFSVKRIRNPKPLILKKSEETQEESSEYNRKSHQRVRRRNSRNSVDTYHPRALAKLDPWPLDGARVFLAQHKKTPQHSVEDTFFICLKHPDTQKSLNHFFTGALGVAGLYFEKHHV